MFCGWSYPLRALAHAKYGSYVCAVDNGGGTTLGDERQRLTRDDAEIYGNEFYRLGFGEAVDKNLLSDYKVLILNTKKLLGMI